MRGQPDGESQRPGGVLGEIPGALRFGLAGPDATRGEVEGPCPRALSTAAAVAGQARLDAQGGGPPLEPGPVRLSRGVLDMDHVTSPQGVQARAGAEFILDRIHFRGHRVSAGDLTGRGPWPIIVAQDESLPDPWAASTAISGRNCSTFPVFTSASCRPVRSAGTSSAALGVSTRFGSRSPIYGPAVTYPGRAGETAGPAYGGSPDSGLAWSGSAMMSGTPRRCRPAWR
jgi:hypothetical protein